MSAVYTFLPWVQEGLSRAIPVADEPGAALAGHVTLPVTLQVDGAGDVVMDVRLYGPGDVTGLDPKQIVRTDPRPGATSFEDNYLAGVEFARADLPWLFTPAAASAAGRLRPWLCLVVVRRQDGVRLDPNAAGPLPVLEILAPARAADELPDLAQSWAWAYAQVTGSPDGQELADVLRDGPARVGSRLLCPRRLQPARPTSPASCRRSRSASPPASARRRRSPTRRSWRPPGRSPPRPTRCACPSTTPGSSRPAPQATSSRSSAGSSRAPCRLSRHIRRDSI